MQVLVHLGPYKTGSTSIQNALRKNVKELAAAGAIMPQAWESTLPVPFLPDAAVNNLYLPKAVTSRAAFVPYAEAIWAALKAEVATSPAQLCILSSEHFSSPAMDLPKFFAHLNEMFDSITVLGYVRHPVDHYVSTLQQLVQVGHRMKRIRPSQYPFGIAHALRRYLDHLPASQIVARNFARDNLVGGDVVKDFCSVLGRLGVTVDLPSEQANESLPGVAVAWLLSVNEAFVRAKVGEERQNLARSLVRSKGLGTLPKLKITDPLLRGYLMGQARAECDWINQTFLTGQKLFDLTEGDGAQISDAAANARMAAWLADYMVPDAMQKLLVEIERHHSPVAKDGKTPRKNLNAPEKVT